jgi:hypothetical protein
MDVAGWVIVAVVCIEGEEDEPGYDTPVVESEEPGPPGVGYMAGDPSL